MRLLYRGIQNSRYFEHVPQRFGFINIKPRPDGFWIHAVSVGEVNAATPLINHLLERYPDKEVTVTTMTPTGSDRVLKSYGDRIQHCYLPYDYPGAVKRFLDCVRPQMAIVMETEIWPNLITRCSRSGIPMIYANVRLSKRSHRGYRKFRNLIGPILRKIDLFAVQAKPDAKRLIRLGALPSSVTVTGSIKFDVTLPASVNEAAQSVRRDLGWDRPVWVVGSTHEGEESQILEAFASIRRKFESLLLVMVPRHPERFNTVFRLCTRFGYKTVLRSETSGKLDEDTEIYLADTMGDLQLLISASDIAFIGGSLVPIGGHNVLEASAAGVPVVFGPHMFNFSEISDLVLEHGAGVQVMNVEELTEVIERLLSDPVIRDQYGSHGKELVERNRGALKKICSLIENELEGQNAARVH